MRPEIQFRSIRSFFFPDPITVRFRPNTDRIDRICNIRRLRSKVAVVLFWPKIGYFSHIFKDIDFEFVLLIIYIKIERQTRLEVNRTQNVYFGSQKAT